MAGRVTKPKTEDPALYKALIDVVWRRYFHEAKIPDAVWKSTAKAVKELMTANTTPDELEAFFDEGERDAWGDCKINSVVWLPEIFARCRHKLQVVRRDAKGRRKAEDMMVLLGFPSEVAFWSAARSAYGKDAEEKFY